MADGLSKRPGTYTPGAPVSDRAYDEALDGWNIHNLRKELTQDDITARDDFAPDDLD